MPGNQQRLDTVRSAAAALVELETGLIQSIIPLLRPRSLRIGVPADQAHFDSQYVALNGQRTIRTASGCRCGLSGLGRRTDCQNVLGLRGHRFASSADEEGG